jgi:hypothetical protein
MTSDGRQSDNTETEALPGPDAQSGLKNAGRRRFGKSGMAATGVLATLGSGPVLGRTFQCTASGHASIGASVTTVDGCRLGRSPGYWKTHDQSYWPKGVQTTMTFKSIFGSAPPGTNVNITLLEVLQLQGDYSLARHTVAAYLNACAGLTLPFLTSAQVVAMWKALVSPGYYVPTPGVKWYGLDVDNYLQFTQETTPV